MVLDSVSGVIVINPVAVGIFGVAAIIIETVVLVGTDTFAATNVFQRKLSLFHVLYTAGLR